MKRSFLIALTWAVASIGQPLLANDVSGKAYDALYDRTTPMGPAKYRMCSDGKGHLRIDSIIPGSDKETKTIIDYEKKRSVMLLVDQKMAWITDMSGDAQGGPMNDEKVKKLSGRALGEKVVNGYKCHGYAWVKNGTQYVTWTGDDTGCLVSSTTVSGRTGRETMKLLKYTETAPSADTFEIPPGFKVQKMGQLGDITARDRRAANP